MKSDAFHRALVESNPDILALLDRDFIIRLTNPALTRLLGYRPADVVDHPFLEFVHPNDVDAAEQTLRAMLDSPGVPLSAVFRFREKAGGWRELEGTIVNLLKDPAVEAVTCWFHDASKHSGVSGAVQESEARFRVLADQAPVMIWLDDANMRMQWENATMLEFTGRSLDEDVGMGWLAFVHPEDLPHALTNYERAFLARQPYAIEYRIRRADGAWRQILDKGVPRWLPDGQFIGYVGCFLDLTELRESAARVQESEDRYRTAISALQEGIIVQQAGDGAIIDSNASALRILGMTREQMLGRTSVDPRWRTVHGDGSPFPWNEHPSMVCLRTGEVVAGVIMGVHKPDGTLTWISINAQPLKREGEKTPYAVVTSITDITDRLTAEQELRRSEERYRAFVEQSSEGVWRMELEAPIASTLPTDRQIEKLFTGAYLAECNTAFARMYGYEKPEDIVGARLGEMMEPSDPRVMEYLRACVESGFRLEDVESVEKDRDGRTKYFLNTLVGIFESSALVRAWGTQRDITERRALEEQFRQARKMETAGRLAGGIAHDFNNLLTAILGTAELLLNDLPAENVHRMDVEEIKRAANRAAGLTRQLLAFSRRQVLQPRILDLNSVVRGTESMLRRVIGEDISFTIRLAPELDLVKADPGQVDQVILNLSVNARDAMPRGGVLEIETRNLNFTGTSVGAESIMPPGRYVMLIVSDTGTGMSPETKRHLFEPFFTTKEQGKGTGLGLATVYGIVKQSGGYIYADTELGKGSTFRVYLPRVEGQAEPVEAPTLSLPAGRAQGTILLVEDEAAVRKLARRVLETSGYAVMEAADGATALRLAAAFQGPIDLTVTDVIMPGMSGQEFSSRIVEDRPGLKVLYVSGYTDDAIVQRGNLLPNTAFLQKPFTPAGLVAKVREVLSGT